MNLSNLSSENVKCISWGLYSPEIKACRRQKAFLEMNDLIFKKKMKLIHFTFFVLDSVGTGTKIRPRVLVGVDFEKKKLAGKNISFGRGQILCGLVGGQAQLYIYTFNEY